jgi:hypothetical protein
VRRYIELEGQRCQRRVAVLHSTIRSDARKMCVRRRQIVRRHHGDRGDRLADRGVIRQMEENVLNAMPQITLQRLGFDN